MTKFSVSIGDIDPVMLFGAADENLTAICRAFNCQLSARGDRIRVQAREEDAPRLKELFTRLVRVARGRDPVSRETVQLELARLTGPEDRRGTRDQGMGLVGGRQTGGFPSTGARSRQPSDESPPVEGGELAIRTPRLTVYPKTPHQAEYVRAIQGNDVVVSIGPAGTGKTYLAVAKAVAALVSGQVARIVLTRPAVEAGESLGFLPGGFKEKVDPYLRPLYDALYDMIPLERIKRLVDEQVVEVAPLAYMRGRTLSDAFVILDEAQNTTSSQMKMFLTRMGWNSKMVVTGDVTQIDLDRKYRSGLVEVQYRLRNVPGIHFSYFDNTDVVRPPIVARIVRAYEQRPAGGEGAEESEGPGA